MWFRRPFRKWSHIVPMGVVLLGGSAAIASVVYPGTRVLLPVALVPLAQVLAIRIYCRIFLALTNRLPQPIRDRIFGSRPMPASDSAGATILYLLLMLGPLVAITLTFSSG